MVSHARIGSALASWTVRRALAKTGLPVCGSTTYGRTLGDEERLALLVDRALAAGIVPPSVGRVQGIDFLRRMLRVFKAGALAA